MYQYYISIVWNVMPKETLSLYPIMKFIMEVKSSVSISMYVMLEKLVVVYHADTIRDKN